jgi:hypothetical protein
VGDLRERQIFAVCDRVGGGILGEIGLYAENTLSVRSAERQGFRIDRSRAPIAGLGAAAATIVIYARERQSVLCSPHMLDKRERGISEGPAIALRCF